MSDIRRLRSCSLVPTSSSYLTSEFSTHAQESLFQFITVLSFYFLANKLYPPERTQKSNWPLLTDQNGACFHRTESMSSGLLRAAKQNIPTILHYLFFSRGAPFHLRHAISNPCNSAPRLSSRRLQSRAAVFGVARAIPVSIFPM